jgi:hypothetical protein
MGRPKIFGGRVRPRNRGASCMGNIRGSGQAEWAMPPGLSPIPP